VSASEISCPHCATLLALPPGNAATRFRCTQCKQVFEAPSLAPEQEQAPSPAPVATQVLVPVPLPAPVPVPAPQPAFTLPDDEEVQSRERLADDEREPRRRRRRDEDDDGHERDSRRRDSKQAAKRDPRRGGAGGMIAIVACVGSVLLVGVAVGGYFVFRDKPKEPVKVDDAKVKASPPPKKQEPLTQEQMVRKVKASTVYVRSYHRDALGTGSGFFAGKPGFVVTNAHVVGYGPLKIDKPVKLEAVVDSGELGERTIAAKLYGVDVEADLALLQLEEKSLPPPLPFGKADALVETQEVVAFGFPFGEMLGKNVSINRTTVSSLRKINGTVELVQLSGGINPGNSGGPVTNAKGEVIGVSVSKLRGTDNIAFAIPAEVADRFVSDQIRAGGTMQTGSLTPSP
jgi:LSD1 subclass zinc finger protein